MYFQLSLCIGIIIGVTLAATTSSCANASNVAGEDRDSLEQETVSDLFWNETEPELNEEERKLMADADCPVTRDRFEMAPHEDTWNLKYMKPESRFKIRDTYARDGSHSLAILLHKNDAPINKNPDDKKKIHKHELRIANHRRCNFGDETWYSFSFRIDGEYPRNGSTRWVIGQWKEETDGSPFLAQRYDNGVFHITIQSNDKRMLIACAAGNPNALTALGKDTPGNTTGKRKTNPCLDIGKQRAMKDSGTLDYQPLVQAIREQQIEQFPFVADPETFRNSKEVIIDPSETPLMPDPGSQWVDMRYRIRGGRDGSGIIEVWANEVPIVKVTGKIGNDIFNGPSQYFKVGHYRDVDAEFEHSALYFDRFKRGTSRNQVD